MIGVYAHVDHVMAGLAMQWLYEAGGTKGALSG